MTNDRKLDEALAAWAKTDPLTRAGDEAAVLRILQHAETIATTGPSADRPRRSWWWVGGAAAVAASAAVALLLAPGSLWTGTQGTAPGADVGGGSVMLAEADVGESAAFALLYTPTSEEEYQL
ncbi:hypothetical protein L6Q21_04410 [Sandaracinobacter sp. RS1-74]|uniref:hypothetical protein n=1 Tax=Sandaracinobacteroides sayramensis TaxID=2913411 RepID=UPI001EDA30CA|nr:hypothetical protein [Sandaracinobacteroides sayramensis]MCG2840223.1 hypothetical protein [Sandaracinobacteroides sayramensis]